MYRWALRDDWLRRRRENFFAAIGYNPSPAQAIIHSSPKRFRITAAGARFGKSMAAGAEIALALTYTGARVWCVGPVYELADREFTWALEFLGRVRLEDGSCLLDLARVTTAARGSRRIWFPQLNSYCQTKSTEKPAGLLGEELDLLVLCEASQIPREPWERMLRARIGPRNGKVFAASTPNADAGLFKTMFDNGQSDDPEFADWESWQFSTLDNPTFSRSEYEIAKRELAPEVFAEQYAGEFVSRRGKVFDLDGANIYQDAPDGIEHWPIIRGIQRGYTNPYVVLFLAINPADRSYWVFDEIYREGETTEQIAPQLPEKTRGRRLLATLADYRDADGINQMKRAGLQVVSNSEKHLPMKQATIKRVQALQNALKIRDDGTTKLHISARCENLIRDLKECKWPDKQPEEAEKAEVEIPLTKHMQGPLALSYVVAFFEQSTGVDVYGIQNLPRRREVSLVR